MIGRVAGLVLAAGSSRRLGEAKQLLVGDDGRTLVERSARQLLEAGCDSILIIVGANYEQVAAALSDTTFDVCENDQWQEGMGSSIRVGVAAIRSRKDAEAIDAIVIVTCDMPAVNADHLRELIARGRPADANLAGLAAASASEAKRASGWNRVGSAYHEGHNEDGRNAMVRGVPALFPKPDWPLLEELTGDRGAKSLVERPDTVLVILRGAHFDIDTPSDLAHWRNRPAS